MFRTVTATPYRLSPVLMAVIADEQQYTVQCPKCLDIQTITFRNNRMLPSRKFFQSTSGIFHDCGSDRPCRIVDRI